MKTDLIKELRCPGLHEGSTCGGALSIEEQQVPPTYQDSGDELREGLLTCSGCSAAYPVICGVAVLLENVQSWCRENYYYITSGTQPLNGQGEALTNWLQDRGWHLSNQPADNYYETPRWVNIFTATHYDPVPAGADDSSPLGQFIAAQPSVFDVVREMIDRHLDGKVKRALDVGTNVGGMAYRIADIAETVLGIDTAFNPVLTARRMQCGYPVPQTGFQRYLDGHRHETREVHPVTDNTEYLVASATQLPVEGTFDLITALNVIDVVPDPAAFLATLVTRLTTGGHLIITSPYSWGSDDVPVDKWLGGTDAQTSSQAVIEVLCSLGVEILEDQDNIPWVLRENQRWYRVFNNHCVIARKRK
jgi:SAM-dependent methyltransferase/uncharacterized protein YbaR (Trm112 family)